MRKLVDAPRKKKQWTEKEEAYLQDKWGTVSIKGLSKAGIDAQHNPFRKE